MDWDAIFGFTLSPWELVLRGTLMYWFLFLLFRFLVRRRMGSVGLGDMLVLVLLADAAQNAMSGEYKTFSEGAVLVATIVGWNVALDWLVYRVPAVRRLMEPAPLPLIRDGRVLRRNLREEFLTVEELQGKLREKGIDDVRAVKHAYLESDGEVSVLAFDGPGEAQGSKRHDAAAKP